MNFTYANKAQEVFGMSTTNCYIFVGIFFLFVIGLIIAQILIKKLHKKWVSYLPFVSLILSIIITLPFQAKVGYVSWGNSYDGITNDYAHGDLWYAQIMQFAIVVGNIYMIFLVIFLISALFFNIIKTMYYVTLKKDWATFFRHTLIFMGFSISMLLLINLYRVFPLYNYDMNNNPNVSFIICGSPIGISNFNHQGYWPFFITNFLIAYFFTGNYDVQYNVNANYDALHQIQNPALPVQVPIVLCLFSLAFIIGIILGYAKPNNKSYEAFAEKATKINNACLNAVYACLSVATLSFFSESLLQSQIGTWLHITFVFVMFFIGWVYVLIINYLIVPIAYKKSFGSYFINFNKYLFQAAKRNKLNDDEFNHAINFINTNLRNTYKFNLGKEVETEYKKLAFIGETIIFAMALIGYLSFLPVNGWAFTSAVNTAGYWFAMFFGSYYCFVGSYGIVGISTVAQNMQASCAFNVMCGTNTGIFGSFGIVMNKIRVQIDLSFLFMLIALKDRKILIKNNAYNKTSIVSEITKK
ncbi:MAG: hypothetical protein IIT81_01670 [Mycoplasmataceae bacterium]|nr:hypothetical protein [Mycoplasmataceae bacterium]